MTHDVFISFSFADQKIAEDIVNIFTSKYGISCWICTRDIDGGRRFKSLIPEAIDAAKAVVFIQSENSLASKEIPKEIGMAFDGNKTIIPFKIDKAQPHGDLRYDLYGVEFIDATLPTMEQRIYELAKSISKAIGKPLKTDPVSEQKEPVLKSGKIICSEIFAGRDALIDDIHNAFEERNVVFLHGMGGIGKSELAQQYWKKHEKFYSTVVFARYNDSLASLIADDSVFNMKGVARKTSENNLPQTDEEYARDKLSVLKTAADEHTLIIIDSFDVSIKDDPFFKEVCTDADYRILVTTRCEPDKKKYFVIPVKEIEDTALKKLFIQYANPNKTIIDEDDADFPELFRLTSRHTYTLELIAKFMEESDEIDCLNEMIDFLREHGFMGIEVDGYDSICKIFRFTSLDENEKYFLRCLAMMPPGGIDQKLFKKWTGECFSARSRLVDLSLVKINGETRTISLHPVVREVVVNELKPSYANCSEFVDRCAMLGSDVIPIMWELPYEEKANLLECYNNILSFITDIDADTYPIYVNISILYNFSGEYAKAIALHERIYSFACRHFGEYSIEAMLILNRIAWKNCNCNLYDRALPYYEKAANWFIQNPCYTSREAQSVIQSCGEVYYYIYRQTFDPSDLDKAYDYFDKFTVYGEKMIEAAVNESEQFQIRLKYQNDCICIAYFKLYILEKKFDMAEKCLEKYKQTILEFQKSSAEPNVDMAYYYRHFAKLRYELGDYIEARDALKESYRLDQHYFSIQSPRMIEILEEAVMCCIKLNDYTEADHYISLAVENAAEIFTDNHPTLIRLAGLKKTIDLRLHESGCQTV